MGTGYSFNLAVCTSPFSWSSRDLNSSLGYLTLHLLISPPARCIRPAIGRTNHQEMVILRFTALLLQGRQAPGPTAILAKKAAVGDVL